MNEFTAKPKDGTIELGMCNPNPYWFSKPYTIEQGEEFEEDSNVFRTFGATHALSLCLTALARWYFYNNKKPILYLYAPFYLDYINIVKNSGWNFRVEIVTELKDVVVSDNSVLLINFPNNPTGRDVSVWEKNYIEEFSKIGFVILDVVYSDMMKPTTRIHLSGGAVIDSLSKRYTWCGMRYGWLSLHYKNSKEMNEYLRTQIINVVRSTTVCPPPYKMFNLKKGQKRTKKISKWYVGQYNKMKAVLDKYNLTPSYPTGFSPFFLLEGNDKLFKFFEEKNVNVLRGDMFGVNKKYFRITTAVNDETIEKFDKVLEEFYNK